MNKENEEILQISNHIKHLRTEANKILAEFGLRHPKTLEISRLLNMAIVHYQKKRVACFEAWLRDATGETPVNIPTHQDELSQYMNELRRRLVMITGFYGHRSSKSLLYSQYLDIFITKYQKLYQR